MIKKISALVLALMLCLSVVVMPASAAGVELGDADIAFALEWDKSSYNAGETAYLSVYMDAKDDLSLYTGSFAIGLNSNVFTQADNDIDTIRANVQEDEVFFSIYKSTASQLAWLATTVVPKVQAANTDKENELYDQYLKFSAAKNTSGSHENANNNKDGLRGSDLDPTVPIMVIALKVADDIADGTVVRAAITSGTVNSSPVQTTWKYYKTPGTGTTTASLSTTQVAAGIPQADTTVTNGNDVVIGAASIVNPLKGQMRYGKEAGTYDVRALAVITGEDFTTTFGDIATAKSRITEIGFVFASGSNVAEPSMDTVKDVIASCANGESKDGYYKKTISQISTAIQTDDYVFSCIVTGVSNEDAQKNSLVAVGYILYTDKDGNPQEAYYTEAQTIKFADYYKA